MGKKYFVLSDIHSFYLEMRDALRLAGFRKRNKDHILIVVGDLWDRGPDAIKIYNFITSIPKKRRILIRGNHESLYLELLRKGYPQSHDFHNRTVDTFCQIAQAMDPSDIYDATELKKGIHEYYGMFYDHVDIEPEVEKKWEKIKSLVSESDITKWIKSDEWKYYYELGPFIFTHSFIPTTIKEGFERASYIYTYRPDWRNANKQDWEEAMWGCPWEQYKEGLFKPEEENGKILVCGHWHTSDFFENLKGDYSYAGFTAPVYYSKGLIGLDGGCTYNFFSEEWNHPQNVLVIDEEFNCYDKYGNKLEEPEEVNHIIRETVSINDLTEDETKQLGINDSTTSNECVNEIVKN